MKRKTALFLLFTLLVTATQAHQLLKLPFLVSHYHHYQEHHHAGGFLAFIHDHYMDSPDQSSDGHDDHHKLPFHSSDGGSVSKLPVSPPVEESNGQIMLAQENVHFGEPVRELRAQPLLEITVPPPQLKPLPTKPEAKPEPRPCKCAIRRHSDTERSALKRIQ